jgi:hypothetical protein
MTMLVTVINKQIMHVRRRMVNLRNKDYTVTFILGRKIIR